MTARLFDGAHRAAGGRVLARWLRAIALLCTFLATAYATAAPPVAVSHARLAPAALGEGLAIYAQIDFELPAALEDAVGRGIALYFVVDFELHQKRWYWFDKKLAARSLQYRLSFSPLTRQYRLARGSFAQSFESLQAALGVLRHISGWTVLGPDAIDPHADLDDYHAQVRFRLDVSRLPKPFQVTALTQDDWSLSSNWQSLSWATPGPF
ncbi:MAG TPA: DUF4390 domain-containing protein [Burkholderiaceae bacterium]|nr:DUF4390 domain-containing protein [Burkholderiaceae bacterium]